VSGSSRGPAFPESTFPPVLTTSTGSCGHASSAPRSRPRPSRSVSAPRHSSRAGSGGWVAAIRPRVVGSRARSTRPCRASPWLAASSSSPTRRRSSSAGRAVREGWGSSCFARSRGSTPSARKKGIAPFPTRCPACSMAARTWPRQGWSGAARSRLGPGPDPRPGRAPRARTTATTSPTSIGRELGREQVVLPLETARGCWWGAKHHCTSAASTGDRCPSGSKSPDRVHRELSELVSRHGIDQVGGRGQHPRSRLLRVPVPEAPGRGPRVNFAWEVKANLRYDQLLACGMQAWTPSSPASRASATRSSS
jgi:hypothetical protein